MNKINTTAMFNQKSIFVLVKLICVILDLFYSLNFKVR